MTTPAGTSDHNYDTIVVGGGVAGVVVATRLGQAGHDVLLLEAGPGEPRPASVRGIDTIAASQERSRLWPASVVSDAADAPPRPYRQGFGLGGGSLVNSLVLSPGDRVAYDRWRAVNDCDWGADDMAPWLERASRMLAGETARPAVMGTRFTAAAEAAGHRVGATSMDQDRAGVVAAQLAKVGNLRHTIADGYELTGASGLTTADRSDGLTVLTETSVAKVLVDQDRATGVQLANGDRFSAPLVVLCCGAIQTPALLLRSGMDRRPVGVGLKDHPSFVFTIELDRSVGGSFDGERAVSTLLRWSSNEIADHDQYQDYELDLDLQAIVVDRVDDGASAQGSAATADGPALAIVVVGLMRVSSTGAVTAPTSAGAASVVTGALNTTDDRDRLRRGVLDVYEILRRGEVSEITKELYIDDIGTPAAALGTMTDDELDRWIASHPGPYAHPACSCPMGSPDRTTSVVSDQVGELGRLLGYHGVHIADASVMPDLVNGGLQLPVAAVAERIAADLAESYPG